MTKMILFETRNVPNVHFFPTHFGNGYIWYGCEASKCKRDIGKRMSETRTFNIHQKLNFHEALECSNNKSQ